MDAGSGKIIPEKRFDDFVTATRRLIGFPLGDQIFTMPYNWGNRMVKYQRYAEKEYAKVPGVCLAVKTYFPELSCPKAKDEIDVAFGKLAFKTFEPQAFTSMEKSIMLSRLRIQMHVLTDEKKRQNWENAISRFEESFLSN